MNLLYLIYDAGIILFSLLILSFAWHFPLLSITKDRNSVLKFTIPISISVQIILGYIFYDFDIVRFFPYFYLTITVACNVLSIYALYKKHYFADHKIAVNPKNVFLPLILICSIFYSRYYDSFKFIAPGSKDTFNHWLFLNDLSQIGHLSSGFYAPGFHLFLYPVLEFTKNINIYRFAGPAIGVITVLTIYLLLKDRFKNKLSAFFLIALLALPVYNQLTLQTISFFSSSLSFILLISLMSLVTDDNQYSNRIRFIIFTLLVAAIAFTLPYWFIQLIPVIFLLYIAFYFTRKTFGDSYKQVFKLLLILVLGFIISFAHVFIQTSILKRDNGFPSISIETESEDSVAITNNYEIPASSSFLQFLSKNEFARNQLIPLINTGTDVLKVKNIRTPDSAIAMGSYLWILISVLLLIYSIKVKRKDIFIVAIFSIVFGVMTETGVFELTYYRGRSGWYLLLLSVIGLSYIFDILYKKKFHNLTLFVIPIMSISCFLLPPTFYRTFYPEMFPVIANIIKPNPGKKLNIVTNYGKVGILSTNISIISLKTTGIKCNYGERTTFLIVDKKTQEFDPVLSQNALSTDKNYTEYYKELEQRKVSDEKDREAIFNDKCFGHFEKFWENENIIILQFKGQ